MNGQFYIGESVSKTRAKQNACENVLRAIFTKQISEGKKFPLSLTETDFFLESKTSGVISSTSA